MDLQPAAAPVGAKPVCFPRAAAPQPACFDVPGCGRVNSRAQLHWRKSLQEISPGRSALLCQRLGALLLVEQPDKNGV